MLIIFDVDGTLIGGESQDWDCFDRAIETVVGFAPTQEFFDSLPEITAQAIAEAAIRAACVSCIPKTPRRSNHGAAWFNFFPGSVRSPVLVSPSPPAIGMPPSLSNSPLQELMCPVFPWLPVPIILAAPRSFGSLPSAPANPCPMPFTSATGFGTSGPAAPWTCPLSAPDRGCTFSNKPARNTQSKYWERNFSESSLHLAPLAPVPYDHQGFRSPLPARRRRNLDRNPYSPSHDFVSVKFFLNKKSVPLRRLPCRQPL